MNTTTNLEEAIRCGGEISLRWKTPYEHARGIMSAAEYHAMLRDFDNALSIIEQEYPAEDDRHMLVTAMRKRWFP